MNCSKCGWQSEDKNYFFSLYLSIKTYYLCSECWSNLEKLIELNKEEELVAEIEGDSI